jgi:histidine phosphotransfer protein HptB
MSNDAIDRSVFTELQATVGPQFAAELVDTFFEEAPGMLAELRSAVSAGDVDRFRRAAHSLKSNASSLGAPKLAILARDLEHSGFGADPAKTTLALTALEAEYAMTAAALAVIKDERHG